MVLAYLRACSVTNEPELQEWRQHYERVVVAGEAQQRAHRDQILTGEPVRPQDVFTRNELAAGLAQIARAANASCRQLVDSSSGRLSPSTVSDLLSGRSVPTLDTIDAYLKACDRLTTVDLGGWQAAWQRVRGNNENMT
jgi:hypothetical protein